MHDFCFLFFTFLFQPNNGSGVKQFTSQEKENNRSSVQSKMRIFVIVVIFCPFVPFAQLSSFSSQQRTEHVSTC